MKTKTPAVFFWFIWAAIACPLCRAQEPRAEQQGLPKSPPMMKVCTLQKLEPDEVAQMVHSLGIRVRVGMNQTTNAVVLAGPEEEVQAALKIIGELDDLPSRVSKPKDVEPAWKSFVLTFFLVEGSFNPEGGPMGTPLPETLVPVAKALAENGVYHLSLLTPVMATCEQGRTLTTVGSLPFPDGRRELRIRAEPDLPDASGSVEVELAVQLHELVGSEGSTVFDVSTTIITRTGEYVVVGASPVKAGAGKALALILRVDAK